MRSVPALLLLSQSSILDCVSSTSLGATPASTLQAHFVAALLSLASLVCRKALGKARLATPDRHEFSRSDILAWGLAAQHGAEQPAQVSKRF